MDDKWWYELVDERDKKKECGWLADNLEEMFFLTAIFTTLSTVITLIIGGILTYFSPLLFLVGFVICATTIGIKARVSYKKFVSKNGGLIVEEIDDTSWRGYYGGRSRDRKTIFVETDKVGICSRKRNIKEYRVIDPDEPDRIFTELYNNG